MSKKIMKLAIACLALLLSFSFQEIEAAGFSVDLIHRDSLESPSLLSTSERVANALRRSINHNNALSRTYDAGSQPSVAEIISDKGEYLLNFSLGTPPVEMLSIADTGSDLIWIQCKPCIDCFPQKAPIFEPNRSSTYERMPCDTTECGDVGLTSCDSSHNCGYAMSYGDKSISRGDVAKDTITLGNTTVPNVIIGCGHLDKGTFGDGASGIVGLGGGKVSLIRQLGQSIQGKFSYCMIPYSKDAKASKMNFGDKAVVSGEGVVSTPITLAQPETFYYLTLEGVTVGEKRLESFEDYYSSVSSDFSVDFQSNQEGNIVIDSGTTLTFLPVELYHLILSEVENQVQSTRVSDPLGILELCYIATEVQDVPEMTFHFKGADVKLSSINTYAMTGSESLCLAIAPASTLAIYGNLAQMNFLVGYDLEDKTVSFLQTDCNNEY